MLTQQIFYRKYGVRLIQQIANPIMSDLKFLEFPMSSVYHYVDYDGITIGPPSDDYLFRNIKKPVLVGYVSATGDTKGNPRKINISTPALIRDYQNHNRRTRILRSIETLQRDTTTLLVYSYSLIARTHKYVRSFFTEYFKWHNTFAAVVDKIAETTQQLDRQHYLFASCPKIIPSVQQLNLASTVMNQNLMKVFRDKDAYLLLELWKWLGEDKSVHDEKDDKELHLSLFSRIPKNKIHLVNIVFQETGKWCVVNLGILNSFLKSSKDDEEFAIKAKVTIEPLQLQKRVLRMLMTIMEVRTVTANLTTQEIEKTMLQEVDIEETQVEEGPILQDENEDGSDDDVSISTKVVIENTPVIVDEVIPELEEIQFDEDEATTRARILKEDEELDQQLSELNKISLRQEQQNEAAELSLHDIIFNTEEVSLEKGISNVCDRLADDGLLSAAEYKRFNRLANTYKEIISPDGSTTLDKFVVVAPEVLKITASSTMPDSNVVLDKSMLKSSLIDFDKKYIQEVLAKDVSSMVLNVQKAGIALTGYKVEKVNDILGGYEMHSLKLNPVIGQQSTLRFKIPIVNEDGNYISNGVKYRLRKQRGDLPIRKVAPNRVALTSYYGKVFINRGRKKSDDYGYWLQCEVMARALDKQDTTLTDIVMDNVFDNTVHTPRAYSALSETIQSFKARGYTLYFDYKKRDEYFPLEILSTLERDGSVVIGKNSSNQYLVLDKNNTIYITKGSELEVFGTFESFLNIPTEKAPVEYCEVVVFGKEIPIGVVLAYNMGLDKLLRLLKVEPRRVSAGSRLNLTSSEYAIAFSDETLVLSKDDRYASIILSGFNSYHRTIKLFSVYSFDQRGVYLNLLEANGLSTRYLREIDLMYQMFIDPIARDLLIEMKEPTSFEGLLLRACQLLMTDYHPEQLDPAFMRIRGYERISGAVYTELIQSLRAHNARLGKSNAPVELNPYAVWKRISEDPSKALVDEINPIESLKQIEAVTYAGTGGRNKRSMTKDTRSYHVNDMGTISESTVDSSDVAVNIFTSADPQFTSLRGISKRFNAKSNGPTALLSTSALLAPGSSIDDPKRVNYIAIQNAHAIPCEGYHQYTVRTGYDSVIAHRSSDLFAVMAKKPGTVKAIDAKGIVMLYDDGTVQGYELGRRFGNAKGLTIPHFVVSPLKVGDKVAVGDVISYNDGFFEPDFFNPKEITLKNSINVKTVLWESTQTLEDASSLSRRASDRLSTKITKVKTIVLNFDQTINKLVKPGDAVNAEDVLCIIEDAVTADNQLFNDASIDTLRLISAQAPRAHVKGIVEKVEVFYHGDKEDMSPSIKALCDSADRVLKKNADSLETAAFTASVDAGFRIESDPLSLDTIAVKIYITSNVGAGIGDKGVFANQMKTVFSEIIEEDMVTEDGQLIDAVFGAESIAARIVNSPYVIGTTNTLLQVLAKQAVAAYKK